MNNVNNKESVLTEKQGSCTLVDHSQQTF